MRASMAATVALAVSSCKRILIVAAIDAASEHNEDEGASPDADISSEAGSDSDPNEATGA